MNNYERTEALSNDLCSVDEVRNFLEYSPETGLFTRKTSGKGFFKGVVAGSLMNRGYLAITLNGKKYLAHRLAWFYVNEVWPENQIDHINGVKTDNRIANLRAATNKQNHENIYKTKANTSGYRGVSFYSRDSTWTAQLTHNRKNIYLGRFATKEQAALVAIEARKRIFTHSVEQQ